MRIDSAHSPRKPFFRASRQPRSTPHRIRLHGPWRWEADPPPQVATDRQSRPRAEDSDTGKLGKTFSAPDGLRSALADLSVAHLRVSRTFHCPTGLDPSAQVDLVIEPISARCTVRLNSISLGSIESGTGRFSVARHLQPTNELRLDLDFATANQQQSTKPRIDVRLEIT